MSIFIVHDRSWAWPPDGTFWDRSRLTCLLVEDYANRKALGILQGRPPRLQVEFTDSLLLEVRPK